MIGLGLGLSLGGRGASQPALWTPDNLDPSLRTNGGWWEAADQTIDAGAVTAWPDRWDVRPMTQATGANRPTAGAVGGHAAAIWPDEANDCALVPAVSFTPAWWVSVLRFRDGAVATFAASEGFIGDGGTNREIGSNGTAAVHGSSWATTVRKNGAASLSATVLPLPLSLVSYSGTPVSAAWSIGRPNGGTGRGWKGPRVADLALGTVPTTDERQRIEGYFAHRFGLTASLPGDHPYKSAAPRVTA